MKITPKQAPELLADVLNVGLVPFLLSSPGIGKSSIAKQIAKEFNLLLIDVRLSYYDPADLNGLPFPMADKEKASYLPFDNFPLEGEDVPDGYDGWLILYDELPSAAPAVQAAAYRVLLDRQVGNKNLHPRVAQMAAGNGDGDNAYTHEMGTAIQSRIIHYELNVSAKDWIEWAMDNDIDQRVIAYISYMPDKLLDFNPDHNDHTFPCPRTWEFVSKIIKPMKEVTRDKLPTLCGTVGKGVGTEFRSFTEIFKDLVTIDQIISDPDNAPIPESIDRMWALSATIAGNFNKKESKKILKYVSRLDIEFQILAVRGAIKKDPTILAHKEIAQWAQKNATDIFNEDE